MEEGPATASFMLSYGLKNVAPTYASSASTSLSAYADLLGHHLRSTLDLIATTLSHLDVKERSGAKSHVRQDLKFTHMDRHHQWYKTQCSNELHK